jgi:hypothetical protein
MTEYASLSAHGSIALQRGIPSFHEAREILDQFTKAEHREARAAGRPINVRFVDGVATLFRGDLPADLPDDPRAIAMAKAVLKIKRLQLEAVAPLRAARAKIEAIKAACVPEWKRG